MSSRLRYLIAYDITENKRLHRIHKKVEAYAIGGQKSFYECWMTETELEEFKQQIEIMLEMGDRVFIFQLHKDTQPMLYGIAHLQSTQPFLLI
ncbi:CRISPR-associated endonuclease Cas2 [Avibacterium avium]|uniref:CRISPR-associated endonuclease Cas2 n=1 Tax=Avibacterium TaxID=292486 RepID=UPI0022452119|nr:CRISPR-associated endonuclease Cas2 [Avibacterium sp. 21-594]MCW9715194.1 CRISPR-associated endonuclease Cas2 [Avibacterium sp. 21-594]